MGVKKTAIGFWEAVETTEALRDKVCCSQPWVDAVVVSEAGNHGRIWYRLDGVFPPGGNKTLMRKCPSCGRICPPNGQKGNPCCDCEAADSWLAIHRYERSQCYRDLVPDLLHRHWPSAISYSDFLADPRAGLPGTDKQSLRFARIVERLTSLDATCGTPDEGPVASDESILGNVLDPRVAVSIAVGHLTRPREGSRKHPGCQLVLLPETEEGLRKEICHYQETGRIMPSARRINHLYDWWTPEDIDEQNIFLQHIPVPVSGPSADKDGQKPPTKAGRKPVTERRR